jgi:hypothetical protein
VVSEPRREHKRPSEPLRLPVQISQDLRQTQEHVDIPAVGPAPGPSMPSQTVTAGTLIEQPSESSYTSTRAAIRELTMPPIPNFDIPDSPPGSPPLETAKKFANFLALKKKGVHFNSKLESSSALRNPGLLQKLMDFAGIDEYDQYATALPDDLAIPTSYPPWAYGEQLNKTQQQLLKKKEDAKSKGQREKIDFVSGAESLGSTPAASSGRGTAGRGISGVDKDKARNSPMPANERRLEDRSGRRRSRSPSPRKRKL